MKLNSHEKDHDPQSRPAYSDYSLDDKRAAVARYHANNGNLKRTAADLNIPFPTLRYWIESGIELHPPKITQLTEKLDNIAHQCADLLPDRLPEASVREIVGAMGQSIQLSQLLKGLPTSITQDTQRSELLIVMQSAMESIEPEGFIEAESKQLSDLAG